MTVWCLPKADTTRRSHSTELTFELIAQSELLVSQIRVYSKVTYTNKTKTPRDNPINMSNRPPTHSPPSPPHPNIFFKRWPLATCSYIHFPLNALYPLPTFFFLFFFV